MLSFRSRTLTAIVILAICSLMALSAFFSQHWFIMFIAIPLLVLLYDVCFSLCKYDVQGVTIRTAQTMITKTYKWTEFKAVKVDRYYPWGRIVLIKTNNKVIYVYCDDPLLIRAEMERMIDKQHS